MTLQSELHISIHGLTLETDLIYSDEKLGDGRRPQSREDEGGKPRWREFIGPLY